MRQVAINVEPVELYKILKFEGLVGSGGEAKAVIENGQVKVNNAVETRKRKKIVAGDVVEFGKEKLAIILEVKNSGA
ncbi:MAG: RNA-binding S4 domain-containing protein [Pseudomonadota bacterium]